MRTSPSPRQRIDRLAKGTRTFGGTTGTQCSLALGGCQGDLRRRRGVVAPPQGGLRTAAAADPGAPRRPRVRPGRRSCALSRSALPGAASSPRVPGRPAPSRSWKASLRPSGRDDCGCWVHTIVPTRVLLVGPASADEGQRPSSGGVATSLGPRNWPPSSCQPVPPPAASMARTFASRRRWRGSPLKVAARKATAHSKAGSGPMTRAPRVSTFMSSCSTP